MEAVVWTALPLVLVGAAILVVVWAVHQRRQYSQHADDRPYGKRLLVRAAPFILLSLAAVLWGVLDQDPVPIMLGLVGALGLTWEVWRRRGRPD